MPCITLKMNILMYMCIIFVKERDPLLTAVNVALEEKLVEIMKGDSFFLIWRTKLKKIC